MQMDSEDTLGPFGLIAGVHPDKAQRDAAEACERAYQAVNTAFLQNPTIHAMVQALQPADDIDAHFRRDLLDAFEDSGVVLPPDRQARARDLSSEMTKLAQDFERRIREDKTQVAFAAAELAGVPRGVWQRAPRDAKGRYLLGLDYPTAVPVIEAALDGRTRERMWRATMQQGGAENIATLARLGQIRREFARLFGRESYADFVLRRRMAGSAAEVDVFLAGVKSAVRQRELDDLAVLRAAKARDRKQPLAATTLQRWDGGFYTERVRRDRFTVDQESFRRHFPPEASVRFVFALAQRLFGVRFVPTTQPLWHPDARAFEVIDTADARPLGTLFLDLYPRPDKYNHAAMFPLINVSTLAGRHPAMGLVTNFDRKGLSLEELQTLLHEFGHAVHGLLSQTRYASQGGTAVKLDFVEAPSQMLEDWGYSPQVRALFREVCAGCVAVPAKRVAEADRARQFAKGIRYSRQHLYAAYDLALNRADAPEPLATWARMEGTTPLGHVAGTMLPAGFGHLGSNYAAGYYSYLWSEVIGEDLRTAFAADRLDAAAGARYRATVLEGGGQIEPAELLRRFLGRPSDSRAFFAALSRR